MQDNKFSGVQKGTDRLRQQSGGGGKNGGDNAKKWGASGTS